MDTLGDHLVDCIAKALFFLKRRNILPGHQILLECDRVHHGNLTVRVHITAAQCISAENAFRELSLHERHVEHIHFAVKIHIAVDEILRIFRFGKCVRGLGDRFSRDGFGRIYLRRYCFTRLRCDGGGQILSAKNLDIWALRKRRIRAEIIARMRRLIISRLLTAGLRTVLGIVHERCQANICLRRAAPDS